MTRTFRYVMWELVEDYLCLGWMVMADLGPIHGQYSTLMEWRCACRQGIIAPRREHSRKPDGIHERIERLVAGPYLELFARQTRPGWTAWGNETTKFDKESQVA